MTMQQIRALAQELQALQTLVTALQAKVTALQAKVGGLLATPVPSKSNTPVVEPFHYTTTFPPNSGRVRTCDYLGAAPLWSETRRPYQGCLITENCTTATIPSGQ